MKHILPNILLLISFSALLACSEAHSLPKLEDVDGNVQAMDQYIGKGKWVLVNVWSPTCTWCLRELPKIEAFNKKHKDTITTVGVTLDYPSFEYGKADIVKKFLEINPIDFPIFLADLDLTAELIGRRLVGIPQTTLFHPDGRVVARWSGDIETSDLEQFIAEFDEMHQDDPFVDPFEDE